jgi:hypothetical protein
MNSIQSALWRKLESFQIDEGDETLTFEKRLAKENGWTLSYSRRVIEEYKRFVFLCAASGHGCTPSHDVDEAWHLHIVYTRSYWDRMCGEVLQRPLHHNPTKGGRAESAKHEDWYARTLRSYRELFGQEPPPDIWPADPNDAVSGEHWKRIDARQNWVIAKRPARLMAGLLVVVSLVGCGSAPILFLVTILVFGVLAILGIIASFFQTNRPNDPRRSSSCSSGGCSSSSTHSSGCSSDSGSGGDCGGGDGGGGGCGSGCGGGCGGGGCGS